MFDCHPPPNKKQRLRSLSNGPNQRCGVKSLDENAITARQGHLTHRKGKSQPSVRILKGPAASGDLCNNCKGTSDYRKCILCKDGKRRCNACRQYWTRTNRERPAEIIRRPRRIRREPPTHNKCGNQLSVEDVQSACDTNDLSMAIDNLNGLKEEKQFSLIPGKQLKNHVLLPNSQFAAKSIDQREQWQEQGFGNPALIQPSSTQVVKKCNCQCHLFENEDEFAQNMELIPTVGPPVVPNRMIAQHPQGTLVRRPANTLSPNQCLNVHNAPIGSSFGHMGHGPVVNNTHNGHVVYKQPVNHLQSPQNVHYDMHQFHQQNSPVFIVPHDHVKKHAYYHLNNCNEEHSFSHPNNFRRILPASTPQKPYPVGVPCPNGIFNPLSRPHAILPNTYTNKLRPRHMGRPLAPISVQTPNPYPHNAVHNDGRRYQAVQQVPQPQMNFYSSHIMAPHNNGGMANAMQPNAIAQNAPAGNYRTRNQVIYRAAVPEKQLEQGYWVHQHYGSDLSTTSSNNGTYEFVGDSGFPAQEAPIGNLVNAMQQLTTENEGVVIDDPNWVLVNSTNANEAENFNNNPFGQVAGFGEAKNTFPDDYLRHDGFSDYEGDSSAYLMGMAYDDLDPFDII
eukprot:Platyproteum_vivax@DN8357_c0_g1_i1.p1